MLSHTFACIQGPKVEGALPYICMHPGSKGGRCSPIHLHASRVTRWKVLSHTFACIQGHKVEGALPYICMHLGSQGGRCSPIHLHASRIPRWKVLSHTFACIQGPKVEGALSYICMHPGSQGGRETILKMSTPFFTAHIIKITHMFWQLESYIKIDPLNIK